MYITAYFRCGKLLVGQVLTFCDQGLKNSSHVPPLPQKRHVGILHVILKIKNKYLRYILYQ